jgi:hypothetical protein
MEDIMDRKLQDKMNIALTREERVLLWNLIGREIDLVESKKDELLESFIIERVKQLKLLEVLIIG